MSYDKERGAGRGVDWWGKVRRPVLSVLGVYRRKCVVVGEHTDEVVATWLCTHADQHIPL